MLYLYLPGNASLSQGDNLMLSQVNNGNLPCPTETFQCNNGECVVDTAKCDDIFHCSDGSDELGCGGFFSFFSLVTLFYVYSYYLLHILKYLNNCLL